MPFAREREEPFYSSAVNLENFKLPSIVGYPRPRLRPVIELRQDETGHRDEALLRRLF